jgi:dTDP-4-amino-4,6-dideoxygalactose transaminase
LVEPDLATYNMDPVAMPASLTAKTGAICVTHLYGKSCRMDEIMAFANEHGLHVVEDCAQSHGARFRGKITGSFGVAGCFSFYPTKNLGGMGDGGAITTDDAKFADRLYHWRNYGSRVKYVNVYPGVNSRLDEIQAALLRVKLKHLTNITSHKRRLAALYFQHLPVGLVLPRREDECYDVFHIFGIRYACRDALRAYLLERGVKTEIHYPIAPHRQQAMRGTLGGNFPIADLIHATELSLPIALSTDEKQVRTVCATISDFLYQTKIAESPVK